MPIDVYELLNKPTDAYELMEQKEPDVPKKEGQWEGWIKPSLKEIGKGIISTPQTVASLVSGVATWPVGKAFGVGKLIGGGTAEEAREVEAQASEYFGYRPEGIAGEATEIVSKGIEFYLTPAKMGGRGVTDLIGPRAGYLAELGFELFQFKFGHSVAGKGKVAVKERAISRGYLNKKLSKLTKAERIEVESIAKIHAQPRNVIKEVKEAKKDPLEKAYDTQEDIWFGEKDIRMMESKIDSRLLKKEIKESAGKTELKQTPEVWDEAVQLYIDTPEGYLTKEMYEKLSPAKKKIVDLARNLPPEIKTIADKIKKDYESVGAEALNADVIKNIRDNYARRTWKEGKGKGREGKKFGTTTPHGKPRKYETIIDGWLDGKELEIKGATENLRRYKDEVIRAIEDKRFMGELRKVKNIKGEPLLTTQQLEGYVRVEHPNFTAWEWAGKAEKGKTYGKNFFMTKEGVLYERRDLYAPKKPAKYLNNILGTSALYKVPGIKEITKFNEVTKSWILQSNLFHHLAFMRSYYLPGMARKKFGELNPRQAYKEGVKSIEMKDPTIMHGVRHGLTLGLKQDWIESIAKERTFIGKALGKTKATKAIRDTVNRYRDLHVDFLFGELGAGLKAKAYEIELRSQVKKYPNHPIDMVAKRVARLINDDFGGLHLGRLRRNPTLQHIFRLVALAPDWTESNIRTMAKTLKNATGDQAEIYMYRKFWGGVVVKGLGVTAIANYALSGGNVDDLIKSYQQAWKDGNLKWMDINVTPIYKMFGGESDRRKYFPLVGHFKDPVKFITHPFRSAKHKGSVVLGMGTEAWSGSDWAGRKFTTLGELLEEGKTVKWGKGSVIDYDQLPSYAISQLIGTQPIQLQNFIGWMSGETEGFDALARSAGLMTSTTYEQSKGLKTLKGLK